MNVVVTPDLTKRNNLVAVRIEKRTLDIKLRDLRS
jgi:hypothetical protein